MTVISTVCPLDLNSRDQLQLIACEAKHLMNDYPHDVRLLDHLRQLHDAAIALKHYWDERLVTKAVAVDVKPKKKKRRAKSLDDG